MTPTDSDTDVRCELLEYLEYQRASVRSIVEGLNEDAWHTPVVASGWTVAGIVEHLGGAERHWFQEVVAGVYPDLPWDEGRPSYAPAMTFTCDRPSEDVLAVYAAHVGDWRSGPSSSYLWRVMARGGLQKSEVPLVSQFEKAWDGILRPR